MRLNTIKIEEFCYWKGLFNDDELQEIIDYCDSLEKTTAVVNYGEDEEIRKSNVSWIHKNMETEWFFNRIQSASNKLNSRFFGFDIDTLDTLQYTIYNEGGDHYTWHWDCYTSNNLNDYNDYAQRKLSAVLQLDDPNDYEGGDLHIAPCGSIIEVEKQKGRSEEHTSELQSH